MWIDKIKSVSTDLESTYSSGWAEVFAFGTGPEGITVLVETSEGGAHFDAEAKSLGKR